MALTTKQQQFVNQYCVDFNATQAAIRAKYSKKTAYSIGQENLKKPEIAEAIEKRLEELAMSAAEATMRLGRIARSSLVPFLADDGNLKRIDLTTEEAALELDMIKEIEISENIILGDGEENAVKHVKTKIKIHDPQKALVDILRMHGKFVDRVDHTTDGKPLSQLVIDRGSSSK